MGITEKAVLYSHFCFSWELSEIGAAKLDGARLLREAPAAFRRLCVETDGLSVINAAIAPAAFRRLCVETEHHKNFGHAYAPSRLQAAVC